ncbi:ribosome maturation factor RimM [Rhizorhapis suberifaciens]|uniref:Ribosome maturation factor RimM n=1 Tax=Rhizorhapis suberifaciens TaxID=13656 RepID=A0A840HUS5_9SPHN|nr:ribosome maturation factor RimM [Rhizorhapis suberifaciens]MBB4641703.1 16S rRNA processing protein RimM [Rhizorhapis suberifaciens]
MSDRTVTLAVIIGAHGVTGEVRLKLFSDDPANLKRYSAFAAAGRTLTLKNIRPGKNGAIARFTEVTDRNAAEALRGVELSVPRSSLPSLGEGEYYHADLIGLPCISTTGEELGSVVAVENFGAGDILEIERPTGKRFMVPMRPAAVPNWGERVVVDAAFVE